MVSPLLDGGNRIQGLLVHTSCGELCIINVYMPCRGSRDSEDNYKDILMQVREIMNTYASSARFILVGDMNASLVREVPTVRDTVFRKFCESHCLFIGENYPKKNTFQHFSGNSSSQIDYILYSGCDTDNLVQDVEIYTWDPMNTSTHVPVICNLPVITKKIGDDHHSVSRKKIRWEKLDQVGYRKQIEREIGSISLNTASPYVGCLSVIFLWLPVRKMHLVLEVERRNDIGQKN